MKHTMHQMIRRGLALALVFAMLAADLALYGDFFAIRVQAADPGEDGSTGGANGEDWNDPLDARYADYDNYSATAPTTLTLGGENTPYIILNADELANFSNTVSNGNNYSGKYIDIQGKDKTTYHVIDLRRYDGLLHGANSASMWNPIGSATPFAGNIYSTTDVVIKNLTVPRGYSGGSFGLFGTVAASANIGVGGGFSLQFMEVASETGSPQDLTVLSTMTTLRTLGGVAVSNAGTIANISVSGNIVLEGTDDGNAYVCGGIAAENTGSITGCNFSGTISSTSSKADKLGGICGTSGGALSRCIVTAEISLTNAGAPNVGGLVGKLTAGTVANGIFSGSITAHNNNGNVGVNTEVGGIVGTQGNATVSRCITSADINVIQKSASSAAYVGGISGRVTQSSSNNLVTESFTMGHIKCGRYVGGIAGYCTSAISDCYSTAAVENEDAWSTANCAGIIGQSTKNISNCYFAGSTLSSNAGSILAYSSAYPTSGTVFYDCQVSPNRFAKSSRSWKNPDSTYAKTTEVLRSAYNGDASWITTTANYPQLAWVTAYNNSEDKYEKLAYALSLISTHCWLNIDDSNAFADASGVFRAYQMKAAGSDQFAAAPTETGLTWGNWSSVETYTDNSTDFGYIWRRVGTLTIDGIAVTIPVERKLLTAVNQDAGKATTIESDEDFLRFLAHANKASGAYIGGTFTIGADIGATDISWVPTDTELYGNLFCCTLIGTGHTISSVTFGAGASSMFGMTEEGKIDGLHIETVNIGDNANRLPVSTDTSLLFRRAYNAGVTNMQLDTVNVYLTNNKSDLNFGLLAAVNDRNFGAVGVSVGTYNLDIDAGENSNCSYIGGLIGHNDQNDITKTGESGRPVPYYPARLKEVIIDTLTADVDGTVTNFGGLEGNIAHTYTNNHNLPDIEICTVKGSISVSGGTNVGGLVGQINSSDIISLKYASFEGDISGKSNVGGLAGSSVAALTVQQSYFVGTVSAITTGNSTANAGGLVGAASGSTTFTGSYSMGNVSALEGKNNRAAGLLGNSSAAVTVTNCYSKTIVTGGSVAGGLLGNLTSDNEITASINNSYFSGQVKGSGQKGGLVGTKTPTFEFTAANSLFDKSIAGTDIPTVGGEADLASECAVATAGITKAVLGAAFAEGTNTNYPQLSTKAGSTSQNSSSYFDANKTRNSDISTRIVFEEIEDGDSLTSTPQFTLATDGTTSPPGQIYTVSRNAQTSGGYIEWSEVLVPDGTSPEVYRAYTFYDENGVFTPNTMSPTFFSVNFNNYSNGVTSATLNMKYDIRVKPFDYGSGTEADPYIIYNIDELLKYKDYLDKGFDTAGQYYKIGSVANGAVVGDPITLDLADISSWVPIMNLIGHLDGNNSVIKNISCNAGKTGTVDGSTYFGFFGQAKGGSVKDLTIENFTIDSTATNDTPGAFRIGALCGECSTSESTFTNIRIIGSDISFVTTAIRVGGLVGNVDIGPENKITLENCLIDGTYSNSSGNGTFGGAVGYVNNGAAVITGCAVYGASSGYNNCGGFIGNNSGNSTTNISQINNSESTVDITSSRAGNDRFSNNCGGFIGLVTAPFSATSSFYGGIMRRSGTTGLINFGGLIGSTEGKRNVSGSAALSVNSVLTDCYYTYDNNRFDAIGAAFDQNADGDDYLGTKPEHTAAKVASTDLASGALPGGFTQTDWVPSETGYYPRPAWTGASADNAGTQQDEGYINDLARFNSLVISYTNAGLYDDDTYVNIFISTNSAAWSGYTGFSEIALTRNERMLVSETEGETPRTVTLSQPGEETVSGQSFTKNIIYTPSVTACGVPDFSFISANPNGMFVVSETVMEEEQNGTSSERVYVYPWTLYTADQLEGLAILVNETTETVNSQSFYIDGNLRKIASANFELESPVYLNGNANTTVGDIFSLGHDIDASVYSGENLFVPIGRQDHAFDNVFNGRGYIIENLTPGGTELGLFGRVSEGTVKNTGVLSGDIIIDASTVSAGGLVGTLAGNATIISCFSAARISGTGGSTDGGGLAGHVSGTGNLITGSFFSGYIYIPGADTHAGGLAGGLADAAALQLRNSYVAGYVDGGGYDAFVGSGSRGITADGLRSDVSATGAIPHVSAPNAGEDVSQIGELSGWTQIADCYPVQDIFIVDDNAKTGTITLTAGVPGGKAAAAIVPVNQTNARSVTSGSVSLDGAVMLFVRPLGETGSVVDGDGVLYGTEDEFTEFFKDESGLVEMKVCHSGGERYFLANLQCWYDAPDENGAYVITTARELAEFAAIVNGTVNNTDGNPNGNHQHMTLTRFSGETVRLGANIDLSTYTDAEGTPISWTPIGNTDLNAFAGTFDGGGYAVSNLYMDDSANAEAPDYSGLFGYANNATIRNVGLAGGEISAKAGQTVGTLVGLLSGEGMIENCYSNVSVTLAPGTGIADGTEAGGLVGELSALTSVSNSFYFGIIDGDLSTIAAVGGIAATNNGSISDCFSTGIVNIPGGTAGGITADGTGSVSGCLVASYIDGADGTEYAIAPATATVTACKYDPVLCPVMTAGDGVETIAVSADSHYNISNVIDGEAYPFAKAAEFASLWLHFGNGNYEEFVTAILAKTFGGAGGTENVSLTQSGNVFSWTAEGNQWQIVSDSPGLGEIIAGTELDGVTLQHYYHAQAKLTLKIRYRFDFSSLNLSPNAARVSAPSAENTFNSADTTVRITSAADYQAFVAYVNGGGDTSGKTFVLCAPVNLSGVAVSPVGSDEHPFEGVFDGHGYTISGLTITAAGTAAMFGCVGQGGVVRNLMLQDAVVTANAAHEDFYAAVIAAKNYGFIANIGMNGCALTVRNAGSAYLTNLGVIAGSNAGRITGVSFVRTEGYGIDHRSTFSDNAGVLVGDNTGTIIGCYAMTDLISNQIKVVAGNNHGNIDNILNCYYNSNNGSIPPSMIYAFDNVLIRTGIADPPEDSVTNGNYFVPQQIMQSAEFARWLSSNIYAGTFEYDANINDGYPYIYISELAKYDLSSSFTEDSVMLTVWNIATSGLDESTFFHGLLTNYDNETFRYFDFKLFDRIIVNSRLRVDMTILPNSLDYCVSARVYGKDSDYVDWSGGAAGMLEDFGNTTVTGPYDLPNASYASVLDPNLIVFNIRFEQKSDYKEPWGLYRKQ